MPTKKSEVDVAALLAEVVALRKEVAELKRRKPAAGGKGSDPRVDVLIKALTKNPSWVWAKDIEKLK